MTRREESAHQGVGSTIPLAGVVAAAVSVAVLVTGLVLWGSVRTEERVAHLVLATGPESGAYHALGVVLARLIEAEGLAETVEVRPTEGSGENMALLESGEADLVIAQSDTEAGDGARLVATLFEEVLHVLLSREAATGIVHPTDLDGRRVSLGGRSSGTRQVARRFLSHFGLEPTEDHEIDPARALAELEEGKLDAVFVLTAVPSVAVGRLALRDATRFLSLGDAQEVGNEADALALVFPRLHATTIPRGTYGRLPLEPVRSVGVRAQLLAHADLPAEFVRDVLETMFLGRSRLDDAEHSLSFGERLQESYEPGQEHTAYHPGAVAYYERHRPSFVVAYAEPISLGLTVMVGLWSASLALRQWLRRSRKNRIDAYYLEVVQGAPDLTSADSDELRARRNRLLGVRDRAFQDLVEERLEADESFRIFQNHIDGELASIERRLTGAQ